MKRPLRILLTAGNTQALLDTVRCVTNIFTGKTGANIALEAAQRHHHVTLLTSHPEVLPTNHNIEILPFRTFEDLDTLLASQLTQHFFDVVIHAAAVSDFLCQGIYTKDPNTNEMIDVRAGKVKSSFDNLWIEMMPAPKLVDKMRSIWNFQGFLVKFKLEVGVNDAELEQIAERSRTHSQANLMCANTYEGRHDWAILGPIEGGYRKIDRISLAIDLLDEIERQLIGQ